MASWKLYNFTKLDTSMIKGIHIREKSHFVEFPIHKLGRFQRFRPVPLMDTFYGKFRMAYVWAAFCPTVKLQFWLFLHCVNMRVFFIDVWLKRKTGFISVMIHSKKLQGINSWNETYEQSKLPFCAIFQFCELNFHQYLGLLNLIIIDSIITIFLFFFYMTLHL